MNRRKKEPVSSASHHTKKSRRVKVTTNNKPPLMSHIGHQGARHLHPERLPTKHPDKTVSVRLLDMRQETIENVQNIAETIKRLMIPGLKLKTIPEGILERLVILEKLDLSNNDLSDGSLPDSMKKLENLVELNLNKNKFTKVPAGIRKLKSLSRLDLSENSLESLSGLEKLRRIQILVLDHNKLSSVFKDISHMKRLEILRCSHNSVKDIGVEVRHLKHLKDLDISSNKFVVLPTDVFLLPKLEFLNASQNKIAKVPSFNIKVHNRHWVQEIDLSENDIAVFPGHLLRMTEKIDLSTNQIRVLNMNAMKELERNPHQQLVVDDNPLTFPPAHITGQKAILEYIHEERLNTPVYRGLKVLVIGSYRSGKSSLVQSMVDQQGRLSEELQESPAGIDVYDLTYDCEMKIKNEKSGKMEKEVRPLQLCIWDLCGHPFYLYPHYPFFEQPSIALLTFNMKEYCSEKFDEMIGSWFDWMIAKTNSLKVVLVGTQGDGLRDDRIKEIKKDVKEKMTEFRNLHEKILNERIDIIANKPEISPTLSEQMVSLRKLLRFTETFTVQADVIVTSSKDYVGFNRLRDCIEAIAKDKDQFPVSTENSFPLVLEKVKTFWIDVENYLEEKSNNMVVPIMKWDEYVEEVTGKFGMRKQIRDITHYLHITGKVVWFSGQASLSDYVFIRPSWLFEVLRKLYRHDFEEKLDYSTEDCFRGMGISSTRFDRNKHELISQGVVDREFFRAMMSDLIPVDAQDKFNDVMDLLVNHFGIGYPVAKKTKELTYNFSVEVDGMGSLTKLLVPWMRKTSMPEEISEQWGNLFDRNKIAALLQFPKYMPPGLFENLCILAHKEKHGMTFLSHWGGGIMMRNKKHDVNVMVSYSRGPDGMGTSLKYELRDDCPEPVYYPTPPATLWTILLPLLLDFEEVIKTFKGISLFSTADTFI